MHTKFWSKQELKRPVRRPRSVWEYTPDIEMDFKETYVDVDEINCLRIGLSDGFLRKLLTDLRVQ
jgi:hypothetical protein